MKSLHRMGEMPSVIEQSVESNDPILSSLEMAMHQLSDYIDAIAEKKNTTHFETHEQIIFRLTQAIGQEALKETLEHYDLENNVLEVNGKKYRKKHKAARTYQTACGPVTVQRHVYACRKDDESFCPLEYQTGLIESYWTPKAAKNALWALSHLPPQEVEDLCGQWGGMNPSRSSLDRLPKALQQHWEPHTLDYHHDLCESEIIPKEAVCVAVSLDGVMIGMKRMANEKPGAAWHEASCGTLSFFNKEGERLKTYYYGRMPESKKVTLKKLLKNHLEAVIRQRPELTILYVADGAQDNWTFFEEDMPLGIHVTDFYHACEYIKKGCEAAYSESEKASEQYKKYRTLLLEEPKGIDKIIRSFRYFKTKNPKNTVFHTVVTYLKNNRERMFYQELQAKNLPIGSGVVEAACKSIVNQRMKRSGMTWNIQGGQAILTFRALIKSHRFEKAWPKIANAYLKPIVIPSNVLPFSSKSLD